MISRYNRVKHEMKFFTTILFLLISLTGTPADVHVGAGKPYRTIKKAPWKLQSMEMYC
jgi:hypothetical protein